MHIANKIKYCWLLFAGIIFFSLPGTIRANSMKLQCNGNDVQVMEQNDVALSYCLNTYKYARVTYTGEVLTMVVSVSGFRFGKDDWDISPHSYGITGSKRRNTLSFTVNQPGYLVLRFKKDQDFTKRLVILIEPPEKLPGSEVLNIVEEYGVDNSGATNETARIQKALDEISGSGRVLYFPEGKYKTYGLEFKSHSRIHLSRSARIIADASGIETYIASDRAGINRFVFINNARDIKVTGLGCIDGNGTEILGLNDPAEVKKLNGMRVLLIRNSSDIHFEGILLKDAARWNTHILGCEDVSFRSCKQMNSLINNEQFGSLDGWDPDASRRVLIENCFGWAGDDNVAIKCTGIGGLDSCRNVEDITVRGNVFLTKKTSLKIGTETRCAQMRNIVFEENDIIEADRVLGINVRDKATVDGVLFKNNRSEYCYPDRRQMGINIYITKREDDQTFTGKIKNVCIEDCSFEQVFPNKMQVSREDYVNKEDLQLSFINLSIAGKPVKTLDPAYFKLSKCNGIIQFK